MNMPGDSPSLNSALVSADVYRDYARVPTTSAAAETAPMQGFEAIASNRVLDLNFPAKLHYVLTELEREGKAHIAGFMPHGRSFKVFKQKEFVDEVLKCWFRQTKYASFQRQLNIYGFTRITFGPDVNACYHECFLRGKPELANRMQRMPVKGQGPRRADAGMHVPNFYIMPYLPSSALEKCPVAQAKLELEKEHSSKVESAAWNLVALQSPRNVAQGEKPCSTVSSVSTAGSDSVSLADAVLAISRRRQLTLDGAPSHVDKVSTKTLLMQSIARRQCEERQVLRRQLEQRLIEERCGGPDLPPVLRSALFSLRNSTL